jgi:ABC-2 type transport system ATP-binding protein
VLTGVSFTVTASCTGLLGPNGAGKSTLLKCLLGQRPVPPGRVQVAGNDPAVVPLRVRQKVGFMPERDVYLPGLNALELCAFCGQLSGMRRVDALARAHEVLNYVGLTEARYREVDGYSSGMRQRARMAAALVHGPELVLLDEPTTGLDPTGREEMLQLIDDMAHRRGVRVLVSSHILRDIERTCDDVVVLNQGRVLFAGSREAFQHQEAQRLQVRVKERPEALAKVLLERGCQVAEDLGTLAVTLPPGVGPEVVWRAARDAGVQIRGLTGAVLSLDQAFERAMLEGPKESHGRPA